MNNLLIIIKCFYCDDKASLTKTLLPFLIFLFSATSLFSQGELWGLTRMGGSDGLGVIFKTNGDGTGIASQFEFKGEIVGRGPAGDLTLGNNGKWYGMTVAGGKFNLGVLFEYDPATNTYTRKIDFSGTANDGRPLGSLTLGSNGKFYGLTVNGGVTDMGVLFEFDPTTNLLTKKIDFVGESNGGFPQGRLTLGSGKLYGMTYWGGANFKGVLFEYDLVSCQFIIVGYNLFSFILAS